MAPDHGVRRLEGSRVLILVENMSVPRDPRVWQECLSLSGAGAEVIVVCPQGVRDEAARFERRRGIEIHRFPARSAETSRLGYAAEYGSAFWHLARTVEQLTRTRRIDVVHASNPPDFLLLAALSAKARGARFVFDHHDLVPELYESRFGKRGFLYSASRAFERLTFSLADVVISTNESYRRIALTRGKKRPEDVFVVRNGPDLSIFTPGQPDPELRRGREHLIGYLGVMGPQDGVDHALRALAHLKSIRTDWYALLAGDGSELPHLRQLAADLGLERDVEFPGRIERPEIVRLLSTADVCLAPEPKSPLNDVSTMVKIAEYMAMARPVVSYDLTESRATAGEAGTYAATNDEIEFARMIDALLSDPTRRRELGALARRRAEEQLAWKHSEPALLAAYSRVLTRA